MAANIARKRGKMKDEIYQKGKKKKSHLLFIYQEIFFFILKIGKESCYNLGQSGEKITIKRNTENLNFF